MIDNFNRRRIFIFNQSDASQSFGVGRYIEEIILEAKNRKDSLQLYLINIGANGISNLNISNKNNIFKIDIPRPFSYNDKYLEGLTKSYSHAIFTVLNEILLFKETDIFHFNNNMQHHLINYFRPLLKCKIVYTIHVSLWKVYFKNDRNAFEKIWNKSVTRNQIILNLIAEKENCENADSVICLTSEMAHDVSKYYEIPKNKLKLIPNGINFREKNDNLYNPKTELLIPEDYKIFMYIGRINVQKGVKVLLMAFLELTKVYEKVVLFIIGDGPLKKELIELSKYNTSKIIFTGYIPMRDIHNYYEIANAIILPSYNEQVSYVMLEAMKYQVPMVVSNIEAFKLLKHHHSCLKIKVSDYNIMVNDLYIAMVELIGNTGLRKQISKNAYVILQKKFSVIKMFNRTYDYDSWKGKDEYNY